MRAGIYVRISEDRTGEAGGVRRQEDDCRALAAQLQWEVVDVYRDNDISASRKNVRRPAYERLWADVDAGRISAVLAYHPKRLYRRLDSLEDLVDRVEAHGITPIRTVAGGEIDLGTATGRAMARITATLAQLEVEELSERVTRKKLQIAMDGLPAGSRRPFGYSSDGMTIVEYEAEAYRDAANMMLNGASLASVARMLNDSGFTGSHGSAFTPNSVRRMLMSGRYSGQRVHRGEIVGPARWPAIITKRDTANLVRILSDPARLGALAGPTYPLTGLLFCARCDGRMIGRPVKTVRNYICLRTGRSHLGVRAEPLELYITQVASLLHLPQPDAVANPQAVDADLLARRDALEVELEELGTMLAAGDVSVAAFRGFERAASERLDALDAEIEAAAPTTGQRRYLNTLHVKDLQWADIRSDPEVRLELESLFERIVVSPARRGASKFEDSRVSYYLRAGVEDVRSQEPPQAPG